MFSLPSTRNNIVRAFVMFIIMFVVLGVSALQANAKSDRSSGSKIRSTSNFKQPAKIVRKKRTVRKKRSVRKKKYIKARRIARVSKKHGKTTRSIVRRASKMHPRKASRHHAHARISGKSRGLHPRLRRLLAKVAAHYGRSVVVTSGCRSHRHNRLIGGAKRSMHLKCMAADIKVAGVSKGSLRRYVTRLPGRGGVGSYCRSGSIHLDVGPRRTWYWGCGGKRRAKSRRKGRRKG